MKAQKQLIEMVGKENAEKYIQMVKNMLKEEETPVKELINK